MHKIAVLAFTFFAALAWASDKTYDFSFKNKELTDIVKAYSEISGKKFVFDSSFRGKATILNPSKVTQEKAFDLMSMALASNGFAIIQPKSEKRQDTYWIMSARNVQRSDLQVYTTVPPQAPERMVTFVFTPKYLSVDSINKNIRILPSKDGEMVPVPEKNQLVISDFSSNIVRISELLTELDKPAASNKKNN